MSGAVSQTLALAAGRETIVIAALGIALPKRGKHRLCPFPHHPDRRPSWRWDERKARYFCTCGTGSIIDLVIQTGGAHDPLSAAQYIRAVLGEESLGKRRQDTPEQRAERERKTEQALARAEDLRRRREAEDSARAKQQRLKALRMWLRRLSPLGTPVETYLREARGITCPMPDTIGYLPASRPDRHPTMISVFGIPNEPEPGILRLPPMRLRGVHLTLLRPDGSGKAAVDPAKVTIGVGHNLPIVVAPTNDLGGLLIAAGIEEALSWHQESGLGAWAAGTANRLPALAQHVPVQVECVTVIVDRDPAGERYAGQLMDALAARGVEVIPCGA